MSKSKIDYLINCILILAAIVLVTVLAGMVGDGDDVGVNQCHDGVAVQYDPYGRLFGDQNGDGVLSGADCEWR